MAEHAIQSSWKGEKVFKNITVQLESGMGLCFESVIVNTNMNKVIVTKCACHGKNPHYARQKRLAVVSKLVEERLE